MHHRFFHRRGIVLYLVALVMALSISSGTSAFAHPPETTTPVWVVSNGFHASLAFRVRDLPSGREISGDQKADAVLIGWGAADFYRGKMNPWTLLRALCGSSSILHVVPVRGRIAQRFGHSDVVELRLAQSQWRILAEEVERAFSRDTAGRPMVVARGYFPESRFFAGRECFYFPRMCNIWVAQKLRASGVPISVPTAITAGELIRQVARSGQRRQRLQRPVNAF